VCWHGKCSQGKCVVCGGWGGGRTGWVGGWGGVGGGSSQQMLAAANLEVVTGIALQEVSHVRGGGGWGWSLALLCRR
jgi:hypothetical protein